MQKPDKSKVFSIGGIIVTTVITTILSTMMQDREIKKATDEAVEKRFPTEKEEKES